mmetsp:Transcript_8932/g.12980  ORF Transcript_8932/g.12980 Transcript_8932/m.12980 type:complete len:483 (+) Transcript_8932:105-1553(+)
MTEENHSPSNRLLPILKRAIPGAIAYEYLGGVAQGNAEGARILVRHSSNTLSEKNVENETAIDKDTETSSASRLLVKTQDVIETELFLKHVAAKSYTHKTWTDLRRTLVYLRTEVRFYNEIVPLLLASNNDILQKQIPKCHHAAYDLNDLVAEESLTTDVNAPSPFPEGESLKEQQLLEEKGGYILLESLSRYFQDSPIALNQSLSCLNAVAELHASAWEDKPLLKKISYRLSSAGGSYHLKSRNPKEFKNPVTSWDTFRGHFVGLNDKTSILRKESVIRLGQRVYDLAEYVSKQLTPELDDKHATLVHGDYKAMNVFLPADAKDVNNKCSIGGAVMIDFSCLGIGYGMSDVGMHIVHAVLPNDLENGGEEWLVEGYLRALEDAMNRKHGSKDCVEDQKWTFPRHIAMRHYQLACIDYLRFILGRFWRSATPETFEKKKNSKNATLVNRNVDAAMVFIEKVDKYLQVFEKEKAERGGVATQK